MNVVLVTVVGPLRKEDLSLPANVPVHELLGTLVERVGGDGAGDGGGDRAPRQWMLTSADGRPLAPEVTLESEGVVDGSLLRLVERGAIPVPESVIPRSPVVVAEGSLEERTRALLPPHHSTGARVRLAVGAFFGRPAATPGEPTPRPTLPPEGGAPRPADLTTAQAPSASERARRSWRSTDYVDLLNQAIAAPRLRRCATIAVVSPKGGVGKTTVSALIGTVLALVRRDRVVAVDTNPDYGSLGRVLAPDHALFVDDLLPILDQSTLTVTALDASLGRGPHGLMVLPAPTDPDRMAKLDERCYTHVIRKLNEFAGITVLDCGTGLQDEASRAAIAAADQIVLVTDAEPATASLVAAAAGLLREADRPITLVVNKMPRRNSRLNLSSLDTWLPGITSMAVIPEDSVAAARMAAGTFNWPEAPEAWQVRSRELVTVLLAGWPELGLTL